MRKEVLPRETKKGDDKSKNGEKGRKKREGRRGRGGKRIEEEIRIGNTGVRILAIPGGTEE